MLISAVQPALFRNNNEKSFSKKSLSFGKIANAGHLKTLFSYGVPCMYSGVEMIDPKLVRKMMKNGVFALSAAEVIRQISRFEESLSDIEKRVYAIIKEQSYFEPEKTVQEIIRGVAPIYQRRLREKQAPIFKELNEAAKELPVSHQYRYKEFMQLTEDKLNDRPVLVPFSTYEFQYKLEKIRNNYMQYQESKPVRVMNKMIQESQRLYSKTTSRNSDAQIRIINFLEIILKRSVISQDEELNNLLSVSKKRLNNEKIEMPFQRKNFIYDLDKLIQDIPDAELKERMLTIAMKLPTSSQYTAAFITKISTEPSEKIIYRLLWPFFASVEHILPKSCGGKDEMSNFGGATTRENSERQNIEFTRQMKRRPLTRLFCQKYVDRMIELVKNGIFKKNNIDTRYIEDFKRTIQTQSKGSIVLNTTDLYV